MPQFRADIDVTSKASTTAQGVLIGTQTTMPAPSINNVGCTVKYTGTAGTYTPGRYYTCVQSGSGYIWQEAETIATGLDLDTGSRAVVTDGSGMAAISNVTSTELGHLSGVTSGIQSQLNGKVPTSRTINGHALTGNVTLKISDLENDSGFITSTVSNLSNYYTKTQTYTKTEVDSRLDAINSMNVSVVSTLPQTGDPHTIYLVPKSASGSDAHQEYLYVSGKWELIGDTSVDLSNYYTKAEVNSRDVSSASWSSNALRIYHTDGTYESAAPSGAASTVMTSNLSTSKVVVTNSSGKLAASSTITTTELDYLNGVTSSIQTQLNNKVPTSRTINGHALTGNITLTQSDLGIDIPEINVTANRAVISDSTGALTASAVTSTELGYLDRVKSNIQDQLDDKQATITGGASTIASTNLSANRALVSNASGKVAVSTVTAAQLGYLSEVTSSIQDQLDNKADADTEITGGAFSNGVLTLNKGSGNISISGFKTGSSIKPIFMRDWMTLLDISNVNEFCTIGSKYNTIEVTFDYDFDWHSAVSVDIINIASDDAASYVNLISNPDIYFLVQSPYTGNFNVLTYTMNLESFQDYINSVSLPTCLNYDEASLYFNGKIIGGSYDISSASIHGYATQVGTFEGRQGSFEIMLDTTTFYKTSGNDSVGIWFTIDSVSL